MADLHGMKRLIDLLENVRRDAPGKTPPEAEHHHFEDGKAARDLRELREVGNGAPREHLSVFFEDHVARAGLEPCNGFQKRRFPGGVPPGDGDELPGGDVEGNVVKDLFRAELNPEIADCERKRHQKSLRLLRRSARRKGTPAIDVTMPIGSIAPAESHLAMREERSMMKPPERMLPGMSQR